MMGNGYNEGDISKCPMKNFIKYFASSSSSYDGKSTEHEPNIEENVETSAVKKEIKCLYSGKSAGNISGCPMMNVGNDNPKNTSFEYHYEIPMYRHPKDFIFGNNDHSVKTKWIRTMPKHLRNTLYIRGEKVKSIRKKEFSVIFLIGMELKEKANQYYSDNKYEDAISMYTQIYSLFKWIEFKDKEKYATYFDSISFDKLACEPIVDEDLVLCTCKIDKSMAYEDDSYRTELIYILKSMSYCYMHLRIFSEAVKCLDEAIEYASSSLPEVLFRRGQARMYNKFSSHEDLAKAVEDCLTAKKKKPQEPFIDEHIESLGKLIEEKIYKEADRAKKLFSSVAYAHQVITEKKLNVNDHIYCSYDSIHTNYKILKEMKDCYYDAIKFFQDTQNSKELAKAYKEFDIFMDAFSKFSWYYHFDCKSLKGNAKALLNDEERMIIQNSSKDSLISILFNDIKYKSCEDVYSNMNFNFNLWSHCMETVNEREKVEEEMKKERESLRKKSSSFWEISLSKQSTLVVFSAIVIVTSLVMIIVHCMIYSNSKSRTPTSILK